jgi:AcrR family transcriptional regulator
MSPRTAKQNQAMREETRARIIRAALSLFSAQGYERTTVKQIAEAAGVAQGLMYSHFAGKDDLLKAIFQQSVQDVYESFALAESGELAGGPVERLIRAAFIVVREKIAFWRLSYGVRMQASVLAALGEEMTAWTAGIRAALERYLAAEGRADAAIQAEVLFATIDGIAQHYVIDPERYPLDAVVEALIHTYSTEQDD